MDNRIYYYARVSSKEQNLARQIEAFKKSILHESLTFAYPQKINLGDINNVEIAVPYKNGKPDLASQRRIAAILSGIDAKIAAEEKVLQKYEKVKKGLMEKLLNEQCKRKEMKKTEI